MNVLFLFFLTKLNFANYPCMVWLNYINLIWVSINKAAFHTVLMGMFILIDHTLSVGLLNGTINKHFCCSGNNRDTQAMHQPVVVMKVPLMCFIPLNKHFSWTQYKQVHIYLKSFAQNISWQIKRIYVYIYIFTACLLYALAY